ncbi:hypothetical protein SEA_BRUTONGASTER_134 [Gordonia phage BrutonGaster]|uniref:Uncharacterized protein n=1 Tax=Gordonia phage BrutonGaster TaxID=2530116 RepID=A0A482JHC5_9CAUD|nr:hypothetical protein HOV26_gp048 [Gordonia phage BrutonGaster]QBP33348.1 hypothetical protein SEA_BRUTONGASTER_134 [Gordonia phage BrutonGaster]
MSEWATVDRSDGPDNIWKGRIFPAEGEQEARDRAWSFGYTILTRQAGEEEWREAE